MRELLTWFVLIVTFFFELCAVRCNGWSKFYNCLLHGEFLYPGDCLVSDDFLQKACFMDDGRFCVISSIFRKWLQTDSTTTVVASYLDMTESPGSSLCVEGNFTGDYDRTFQRLFFNNTSERLEVENKQGQVVWSVLYQDKTFLRVDGGYESYVGLISVDSNPSSLTTSCKQLPHHISSISLSITQYTILLPSNKLVNSGYFIGLSGGGGSLVTATATDTISRFRYLKGNSGKRELNGAIVISVSVISEQSERFADKFNYLRNFTIQMNPSNLCDVGYYRIINSEEITLFQFDRVFFDSGCASCPQGKYRAETDPEQLCIVCPEGQTTAISGAVSKDQCYGVLPSTIMGSWAIIVFLITWLIYFVNGRLFRLATRCKFAVSRLAMKNCEVAFIAVSYGLLGATIVKIQSAQTQPSNSNSLLSIHWKQTLRRVLVVLLFVLMLCCGIVIAIAGLLVNAMIMIKSSNLSSIFVNFATFSSLLFEVLYSIAQMRWFQDILYPFLVVINALSNISLPFDSMQVTCDGPSMLSRLAMDLIIIMIVCVLIWSDIAIYWNVALKRCIDQFGSLICNQTFAKHRRLRLVADIAVSGLAWAIPDPCRVVLYVFSFLSNPFSTSSAFMRCGNIDQFGKLATFCLIACYPVVLYTIGCFIVPSFRIERKYSHERIARMSLLDQREVAENTAMEKHLRGLLMKRLDDYNRRVNAIKLSSDQLIANEPHLNWLIRCIFTISHSLDQQFAVFERLFEYNLSYLVSGQSILQSHVTEVARYFREVTSTDPLSDQRRTFKHCGLDALHDVVRFIQSDLSDTHVLGFSWAKVICPAMITVSYPAPIVEEQKLFYDRERITNPTFEDLIYLVRKELACQFPNSLFTLLDNVPFLNTLIGSLYMPFTYTGQHYMLIVLKHYALLLLVSFGVWTDLAMDAFQLNGVYSRLRAMSIRLLYPSELKKIRRDLKVLSQLHVPTVKRSFGQLCWYCFRSFSHTFHDEMSEAKHQPKRVELKRFNLYSAMRYKSGRAPSSAKEAHEIHQMARSVDGGEYLLMMSSIVAVRAVFWQFVPVIGGFLSVMLADLACCPLFIRSPSLRAKLPPLILMNPVEYAKELMGVQSDDKVSICQDWLLFVRVIAAALYSFITQSRLIVFLYLFSKNLLIFLILTLHPGNSNSVTVDDIYDDDYYETATAYQSSATNTKAIKIMAYILVGSIVMRVSIITVHFTLSVLNAVVNDQSDGVCRQFGITKQELQSFACDTDGHNYNHKRKLMLLLINSLTQIGPSRCGCGCRSFCGWQYVCFQF